MTEIAAAAEGAATTQTPAASEGGTAMTNGNTQTPAEGGEGTTQNAGEGANTQQPASNESAEGNTQQTKEGEGDGKNTQDPQTSSEPTEYSDFTMPEGFDVNEEVMGEFKGMLGEVEQTLGQALPQETAQKFVDMGANLVQQGVEMAMQQASEYHAQKAQEYITTFQNDAELGGTEENQQKTLSEAKRVAEALGGDALIQAIDETGAGNHPEIIRAFFKLKDVIGEDGKVIIANQGGGETNLAKRLYPDQT